MAIQSSNKVNPAFNMSSMTDIVFLLLIFFMVTSTMVAPNALKLLLPQSNNQTAAKPKTTVSITKSFDFYVEDRRVRFSELESVLRSKLNNTPDATISVHADKSVPIEQVVKVMNIAKRNKYKVILATSPLK